VYSQGADEKPVMSYDSAKGFGYATDLHVNNFVDCIRSRKGTTAPIALGFQATRVLQMANLSLKHGREVRWDNALQKVEV
jgi:hypothetical protein